MKKNQWWNHHTLIEEIPRNLLINQWKNSILASTLLYNSMEKLQAKWCCNRQSVNWPTNCPAGPWFVKETPHLRVNLTQLSVDPRPHFTEHHSTYWTSIKGVDWTVLATRCQTFRSFSRTLRVFLGVLTLNMVIKMLASSPINLDTKKHIKHAKAH